MTRADIVKAVRGLLTDDAFDEDLITQAANWFVYELFNDIRTRLMESSDTVYALAGDINANYPSDLMTRIGIWVTSGRAYEMPDALEYKTFMNSHANFATATAAEARTWTDYGNAMRFAAPLKSNTTFQIDYLREPEAMEEDDDECEVPDRYGELVAKGTLARIMEINEDYAEAQQERDNLAPLVTTFKRNEGRGGGKIGAASVMRTNRRGRGSGDPLQDGIRA
jgi:hypothetical protein